MSSSNKENETRVLPHNDDAEKFVLGAIFFNPESYTTVSSVIDSSDFYQKNNSIIFESMMRVAETESRTLDVLLVAEDLKKNGLLDKAGGISYLTELTNQELVVKNVLYYCNIIKEASKRRNLYQISTQTSLDAFDPTKDITDSLDEATQKLTKILIDNSDINLTQTYSLGKIVMDVYTKISEKYNNPGLPSGKVKTGFINLDNYTNGGLSPADYVIVAARPSIGKTAFAISVMVNMIRDDKKVAFFSLETPADKIVKRMLSINSKVGASKIEKAALTYDELQAVMDASGSLFDSKSFIIDVANISLSDLRAKARTLHKENNLDCIIIDYIGLISLSNTRRDMPNFEKVSEISKGLKNLARELNIPLIVLCQVNRDSEDKEPMLSNLRDSGSIEQDADLVCFLHRKRNPSDEDRQKFIKLEGDKELIGTRLIVAKNRNGETRDSKIGFIPQLTAYVDTDQDIFVPESKASIVEKVR